MVVPVWLSAVAWIALALGVISAAAIVIDMMVNRPPMMPVMRAVWPVTALYMGPLAVWAYWKMQRRPAPAGAASRSHSSMAAGPGAQAINAHSTQRLHEDGDPKPTGGEGRPLWQAVFVGATHCGAGCTLGDILAEAAVAVLGVTIAGLAIWPEFIGDYAAAYVLGIAFQYFSIAPMRGLSLRKGIAAAVKADTLSLTAFEVGLFGWMALNAFFFFHHQLHPDSAVYWLLMQVGMLLGFATSYPMNWLLIRRGIKERM
jgi:hypothetical protein